tara:strand:- start:3943 stop:4776 length:834 start_codon:yes stop_codon:yes gene_type:complete
MKCLVIGYGNMGSVHAKYFQKNNIDWKWYDPESKGPASKRVLSLDKAKDFDKIFITSPEHTHYENYKKIREVGYDGYIFVEKPAALNIDHVAEMLSDKRVMVGMVERFNPAVQTLKSVIDKDKLINIDFSRCCVSSKSSQVSIFEDIGLHDIDLLFFLLNLDKVENYKVFTVDKTTIFTSRTPLCRMIWSKDTFFKERKIIVRQTDCTYEVDLQEQSAVKHWEINGHHVSQSLFVEKSSPIENEQNFFFKGNVIDCHKSHNLLLGLIEPNEDRNFRI